MAIQSPVGRHHVREEIQRRILSGESQPGERLTQQSLAKELGVAQGTVRESLLELQWLGLVESIDRLGVFVGKIDAARLCEAYQVREFLEGLAARLACEHASRADVAGLRKMADHIWNLSKEKKEEEMGAADRVSPADHESLAQQDSVAACGGIPRAGHGRQSVARSSSCLR
jgi:DNA-binding GntR family transcriptional regulator